MTRLPASRLSFIAGQAAASTPMTLTRGRSSLIAIAMPEMSPPPPIGTSTTCEVGHLLEQLERDRALARDHGLVVEGVDGDQAALLLDLERVGVGLVEVVAVEDDLGAVLARVGDLDQRRAPRHHDGGRDAARCAAW